METYNVLRNTKSNSYLQRVVRGGGDKNFCFNLGGASGRFGGLGRLGRLGRDWEGLLLNRQKYWILWVLKSAIDGLQSPGGV
jgi:hypothetical protein